MFDCVIVIVDNMEVVVLLILFGYYFGYLL